MRKLLLGVMGATFVFALTAGVANATHNTSKQAKQLKGELVKVFTECTAPNTATSNAFPACSSVSESDPKCTFTTKGKGKFGAKYIACGPDGVCGNADDGDIAIQVTIGGLNSGCNGQSLLITSTVRATSDDCAGSSCTVVDLTDFPLTNCTVDSVGNCKLKTTVNSVLPGTLLNGKRISIEIMRISMFNGANRLFDAGILVP